MEVRRRGGVARRYGEEPEEADWPGREAVRRGRGAPDLGLRGGSGPYPPPLRALKEPQLFRQALQGPAAERVEGCQADEGQARNAQGRRQEGHRVLPAAPLRRWALRGRLRWAYVPHAWPYLCVLHHWLRPGPAQGGHDHLPPQPPAVRRRLGHTHRGGLDHVRDCAQLRVSKAPWRAVQRRAGDARARVHQGPRRRPPVPLVGQVLALRAWGVRVGGGQLDPVGDVVSSPLVPLPPRQALVPLPYGLPTDVLSLLHALPEPYQAHGPAPPRPKA
mmetsp:Transcript_2478/g.5976  ORF Transcript_2478/g.5976 Transcript_2478/m.5976 type:complete len:275 (-) Transcript_2478:1713-2537(-)